MYFSREVDGNLRPAWNENKSFMPLGKTPLETVRTTS